MALKLQETRQLPEESIKLEEIDDGPNMRTDLLSLTLENQELCESIQTSGLLQPIGVISIASRFKLIYGQRRVYCCRMLGHTTIRATVYPPSMDDGDRLVLSVAENAFRVDADPVSYAEALKAIKQLKEWTSEEVAKATSLNPVKVSRLLQLADQTPAIKSLVKDDQVGVTTALEFGRLSDEEQRVWIPQIRSKEMSRQDLIDLRKAKRKARPRSNKRIARATAHLDAGRSVTVAAEVVTIDSFLECLETLLPKVRRAKQAGISLKSCLSMIRDQSGDSNEK